MKQGKFFSILLLTIALILSSCAAYFSVYGVATMFSGALIAVAIMAGTLELSKLVTVSFLFRYWKNSKLFLRIYLILGLIVLMAITSFGIFGFLSVAYQKSSTQSKIFTERIQLLENQKISCIDRIKQSNERIDNISKLRASQEKRLSDVLNNENITRNPIELQDIQTQTSDLISKSETDISNENKKIKEYSVQMDKINEDIESLKIQTYNQKDILTFQFVANALHTDIDTIAKWFILTLIVVFDPMAICLLLAYNTIIFSSNEKEVIEKEVIKEVIKEVPVETIKEVPVEIIKEIIKEVPVEVIKEVIKEVPIEVTKEVPVEKKVEPVKPFVAIKTEVPVVVNKNKGIKMYKKNSGGFYGSK